MGNIVKIIIMMGKIIFVFIISSCTAQLKFGGSAGSSGNTNTGTKQPETDTRFFTGNQALDGGIVGLGAGLLGGAVLSGALSGGSNGCGRRRRQAPGEDQPGTRFFGLENLLGINNNNNNCCNNCGYNNNNNIVSCQCRYDLTFQDNYGNTHGACKRADESGRVWCYTTGWGGCSDARQSNRYPNNPWSYQACPFTGKK